jgi:hypothetical protein
MAFNPSSLPCCTGRGPFGRLHHRTMKLVMTLLARDEEDILASNLDFHVAHGVDFFIATDNLSVDRTSEILRSYERRGLLHYIYQSEDDYSQGAGSRIWRVWHAPNSQPIG